MKKLIVAFIMSVGLYAGGDLPEVAYVAYDEPQPSPFYVGIGIGFDAEYGRYYDSFNIAYDYDIDEGYSNISILAGAVVAREGALGLAVEARLSNSFDEYGVDTWGIYAKPEFEANRSFTVFGVIGYQNITTYDYTYDATGIGVGGVVMFTDSIGAQVDYIYSFIAEDEYGFIPEYSNITASVLYKF